VQDRRAIVLRRVDITAITQQIRQANERPLCPWTAQRTSRGRASGAALRLRLSVTADTSYTPSI
jgi:hypothetical protein